ncbi:MAG: aminotransferase class V-fold PLP-dependent enzyme [Gemmatimonadota bacterium]
MTMHSLALNRVYRMSRSKDVPLTDDHMRVLEYAWVYYRKNSVGPLFRNIKKHTGVGREDLADLFPAGLSSVYTWVGIPIQSRDAACRPMATIEVENPRDVYLDHNATTPIRSEVTEAMVEFLRDPASFGNPSSSYDVGSQAFDVLDEARGRIAKGIGVDPAEIFFVGSGSEANNIAILGAARQFRRSRGTDSGGSVVCTRIEHPSVLETVRYLGEQGFDLRWLDVKVDGTLDADQVAGAISDHTALVSVMAANNEIGTVYPIGEIGQRCRDRGVPFFVDAIQAYGKIPIQPKEMGISMLSLSGHKIYAPKGVGALYVDSDLDLPPLIHGGSQESGLRAGTENVLGIMALGLAAKLAFAEMEGETARFLSLRGRFLEALSAAAPGAIINGTLQNRLPHNLSVGFPEIDAGSLLLSLNQIGIAVSAGSACSAGDDKVSHVLQAIGAANDLYGTVRFSFGKRTTEDDLDYLFEHLPRILDRLADERQSAA